MATRKTKKKFDAMGVILAAGGGAAAGVVTDFAEDKIPGEAAAAIPAVIGSALVYFTPEYAPAGYGMIGAAAADFVPDLIDGAKGDDDENDDSMDGFNRASFQMDGRRKGAMKRARMRRRMENRGILPRVRPGASRRGFGFRDKLKPGGRGLIDKGRLRQIVNDSKVEKRPGRVGVFAAQEAISDMEELGLKNK